MRIRQISAVSATILSFACLAILSIGCGPDGPELYEVSGTATHNGKPLADLEIRFFPVDGSRPSTGKLDENGKFTLTFSKNRQGAVGGEHVVSVEFQTTDPDLMMARDEGRLDLSQTGDLQPVLEKYGNSETSPYRVTISEDTDDLELKLD